MIRFTTHKKKNYRQSNLWMNVLQGREQQKTALHMPPVTPQVVAPAILAKRQTIALHQEHVIVTGKELSATKEQRQLQSLQTELADLPSSFVSV